MTPMRAPEPMQKLPLANVLIVDDDPLMRPILGAYFATIGVPQVDFATDGQDALNRLDACPQGYDVIITDLKMPGMDGLAFMRALKDLSFEGHLVVVSGVNDALADSALQLSRLHGFRSTQMLKKPVDRAKLDQVILQLGMPEERTVRRQKSMSAKELKARLDANSVFPVYQPKVDVWTGRVVGAEALARLADEDRPSGMILPVEFIDIAEQSGLVDQISLQLVARLLDDMSAWSEAGCNVRMSFNVSAASLKNVSFTDRLFALISSADVANDALTCELTETAILEKTPEVMESITRLTMNGIKLAIDDFGTGSTSIERLRDFPHSELKIDRSFAANGCRDTFADASVRSSILLGRNTGMLIVAEGIETPEEWDYIAKAGVDEVQGYIISRPLAADAFLNWYLNCGGVAPIPESSSTN